MCVCMCVYVCVCVCVCACAYVCALIDLTLAHSDLLHLTLFHLTKVYFIFSPFFLTLHFFKWKCIL